MRGSLSEIYSGETMSSSELAGTTRIVVAASWGSLGPAPLSDVATWLGDNGLVATADIDQPNGVAGLDENGQLVGPIIVSNYADNAAAGTPALGVIFLVNGELRSGDNATEGGLAYLTSTPEFAYYSTDTSVSLDINKSGITSFLLDGAGTDLTITNIDDMPLGYKFDVVIYAETGQTLKIKINDSSVYDQVSLTAGATGYYAYSFIKVTQALGQGDLVELSYKFTAL